MNLIDLFCYVKYTNGDYSPPVEYSVLDATKVFYHIIKKVALDIAVEYYDKKIPMKKLSKKQEIEYKNEKICYICKRN